MTVEKVSRTYELAKETTELAEGLSGFTKKTLDALADGWQTETDMLTIFGALTGELVPALDNVKGVGTEAKEAPEDFLVVWAAAGKEIWRAVKDYNEKKNAQ